MQGLNKRPTKKPQRAQKQLTRSQRYYRRHRQEILEKRRRRLEDPVYRKKMLALGRRYALKKRCETIYGISLADYDRMYEQQGGRCRMCKRRPKPGRSLCIDHNHVTRKVRGLLCNNCNCLIGFSGDDPSVLMAGSSYLRALGCEGRLFNRMDRRSKRRPLDHAPLLPTRHTGH
jgi:Recombination endonuclease VII